MSWALLVAAFAMGFFGSPHCLGMCGGIVTAFGLSMQGVSNAKKNALILTYHFGRLLSYALLGLIAGSIGASVLQPLWVGNDLPRILIGVVLVLIGLTMFGMPLLNHLERFGMRLWQAMAPVRKRVFPIDSFAKALMAGLLWGFLPCGLVYGALLMAVVGHDIVTGALLMFVFGLGTMPMLIATQKAVGVLQQKIKTFRLRQLNGGIMVLSGLAVIFLPMAMHAMHGNGHSNHASMNHAAMHHDHMPQSASVAAASPMLNHVHMGASHADSSHAAPGQTYQTQVEQRHTASTPMPASSDMPQGMNHMNHGGMDHSKMHPTLPNGASSTPSQ